MRKKKGATLAYVIVVLAIVAIIGTAIVSLALTNYKSIILNGKRTENLYMSESGLDKLKVYLDNITAYGVEAGNKAVDKLNLAELSSSSLEDKQNKVFKESYEKSVEDNLKKLFKFPSGDLNIHNLLKSQEGQNEFENYDIKLLSINGKNIKNNEDIVFLSSDKDRDNKSLSLRVNSKFNVNNKNYKNVTLTYEIEVPNYNGKYTIKTIPVHNIWTEALVVGNDLNINPKVEKNSDNLTVDGGIFVSANADDDQLNDVINNITNEDINGVIISGGTLKVRNGDLISKEDIRLNSSNSNLSVGNINEKADETKGVFTGNIGVNDVGIGSGKDIKNSNISSQYPVYAMNDLILNGVNSKIKLSGGFYGINSNRTENEITGKENNSSAIIVNSPDMITKNDEEDSKKDNEKSSIEIGNKAIIMGSAYINTKSEQYQTGESVAIKGNYIAYTVDDGSGVTFKYYNPLQLIDSIENNKNLTVEDKAKYFNNIYHGKNFHGEYLNNDTIKNYLKEKISVSNISLPEDTKSIGVTISGNDIKFNNITLEEQKEVRENQLKEYLHKTSYIGNLLKKESEIAFPKNEIDAKKEFINNKDLIYIDSESGSDNNKTLTIESGQENNVNDDTITFKEGNSIAHGQGIIITNKDIVIQDNIDFKGTIITTKSLTVKGENNKITYDKEYLKVLIGSNYDIFKNLFVGKGVSEKTTLIINDGNNSIKDLVKTSNWEVN